MESNKDLDYRAILNAIPLMIFVVDEDVRVYDLNEAAVTVFGPDKATILNRRGGEIFHCLQSNDVPEGCGRGPSCRSCVIRNSVTKSLQGQAVTRRRTKVKLLKQGTREELEWLITASPMSIRNAPFALLVIEDISEICALRDIIPICARCKKVRDDQQYWQSIESYFNQYIGVDFSHGLCPTCVNEFYPEFAGEKDDRKE